MPKYNIKEIKKRANKDYPADINEDAEIAASAEFLNDPNLKNHLEFLKAKPWFGELLHYNKDGVLDGKFEFDRGIVRQYQVIKVLDERNVFVRNIRNKKLYSEKDDKKTED